MTSSLAGAGPTLRPVLGLLAAVLVIACGDSANGGSRLIAKPISMSATDTDVRVPRSCNFIKLKAHDDGGAILQEYVGLSARPNSVLDWLETGVDCPMRDPTRYAVVASADMVGNPVVGDAVATAVVETRRLGYIVDSTFRADYGSSIDTIRARLTKYGWRVVRPPSYMVLATAPRVRQMLRRADTAATVTIALLLNRVNQHLDIIRHLPPSAFPALGAEVRQTLEQRGCTVPQAYSNQSLSVVSGAFTEAGRQEWAVLCSVADVSQILILDAKTGVVADSLNRAGDAGWVAGAGSGQFEYDRLIRLRPLAEIRAWRTDTEGHPIPQPIDHDAIEDVFSGKASEAYYCAGGKWFRVLTGD